MKSLLISGISGQVGMHVAKLAKEYSFNVVCGIDRKTFYEFDCPIYQNFNEVKENVDVIIDFSSPSLTEEAIDFATERGCALVSGTTALLVNQKFKLKLLSQIKPVCHSNNFSQNIIHFLNASKVLKNGLTDFDVTLIESHNRNKKDTPSGTAKHLSEILGIKNIHSVRGGNISGLHKIIFLGNGEEIEITHRAYEKSIFAKGSLYCAQKLLTKEKGLYSLNDLINE